MRTLETIVATHRARAASDERDLAELVDRAKSTPEPRNFSAALSAPGLSVIAEVKRRSPSAGDLNVGLDPASLAQQYAAGGAACISVLTDQEFFGGSMDDLRAVRSAVDIPVLRKDFTVDERDIADARTAGADAVLLIVAALTDDELASFLRLASELHLTALVETHDADEVARATAARAEVIGVNQRNLKTFELDPTCAAHLYPQLGDCTKVAESAVRTVADAHALRDVGYDAVLIGTALVTNDDPAGMLRQIVGA